MSAATGKSAGASGAKHTPAITAPAAAPAERPLQPPADAEELVGRRVARQFRGGEFGGVVVSARTTQAHGVLWRVCFQDGDEEDLNWAELRVALVPDTFAAAGGTASTVPSLRPAAVTPSAGCAPGAKGASAAHPARQCAGVKAEAPPAAAKAQSTPAQRSTPHALAATVRATPSASLSAPPASSPVQRRYKGVQLNSSSSLAWKAVIMKPGLGDRLLLTSNDAVACAHAYDHAARQLGLKPMNFPRPGTDEVQAVFRPRAAKRTPVPTSQVKPHTRRSFAATQEEAGDYYGVSAIGSRFQAKLGATSLGLHDSAEAAALAVDAHARKTRFLGALNFPANDAERAAVEAARPLPPPDSSDEEDDSRDNDAAAAAAAAVAAEPANADKAAQAAPQAAAKRTREPGAEPAARRAPAARTAAPKAEQQPASVGAAADAGGAGRALALMPPAAAAHVAAPAHAEADAATAGVAAFLRSIRPPLSQLAVALAALPDSGLSMEHLAAIAATEAAADRQMLYAGVAGELSLTRMADRVAFVAAVSALAPRGAARGGMGLMA